MHLTVHTPRGPGTLDALVSSGSLDALAAAHLGHALRRPQDPTPCILVAGGTFSGRTTVAGCLAAAAGMRRPVIGASQDGDLHVHRRGRVNLAPEPPSLGGLAQLLGACADAERSAGHPPVLVVDGDRDATGWALRAPAAKRLARIITTFGGSASGALTRLDVDDPTDPDRPTAGLLVGQAVAAAVQFVVHCDRDSDRRLRQTAYAVDGVRDGRFQLTPLG